jgi:hypothetical protein
MGGIAFENLGPVLFPELEVTRPILHVSSEAL